MVHSQSKTNTVNHLIFTKQKIKYEDVHKWSCDIHSKENAQTKEEEQFNKTNLTRNYALKDMTRINCLQQITDGRVIYDMM